MTVQEKKDTLNDVRLQLAKLFFEGHKFILNNIASELDKLSECFKYEELFGFDCDTCRFHSDVESIVDFEGKGGWKDDFGNSPKDELLYKIEFSSGAYFLGYPDSDSDSFYPMDTFKKFFEELKTFNPAFIRDNDYRLYFRPSNAKAVYDALPGLVEKYLKIAKEENKREQRASLEASLRALDGEN